jgi:predicted Zn finger-like uncharacterized protein
MHTECPHCQTLFRITQEQLEQANGNVRCCRCGEIFNGNEQLHGTVESVDNPISVENDIETGAAQPDTKEQETLLKEPSHNTPNEAEDLPATLEPEALHPSHQRENESTVEAHQETPDLEPSFGESKKIPSILWPFACLFALAALLLQLAWFERDLLIQHPDGAKLLKIMCQPLGCTLPPLKNTRKIEVVSRNFGVHPDKAGILQFHLTIISHTQFDQVYPKLQLNLFNSHGQLQASRIFEPAEYFSDTWPQQPTLMPAKHEIEILMELLDPGEDVTGFKLEFL